MQKHFPMRLFYIANVNKLFQSTHLLKRVQERNTVVYSLCPLQRTLIAQFFNNHLYIIFSGQPCVY